MLTRIPLIVLAIWSILYADLSSIPNQEAAARLMLVIQVNNWVYLLWNAVYWPWAFYIYWPFYKSICLKLKRIPRKRVVSVANVELV